MKEWYLSHQGEISGPFGLTEANLFIAAHPDSYAWEPSFAQWVPVSHIDEFELKLTPPPPPKAVPQALIERVFAKEQGLKQSLEPIAASLTSLQQSLSALGADIKGSKTVTQSLNQEVNQTLRTINEQYEALQKKLAGFAVRQG
ncbi:MULTISPECIES: DUF4339 domain-containing protein [Shewanella]|uniref:DUF4339 domain-containing protein n=1 Tax=Shewanella litorisediminis TaxID=1173586 RepID=A0ABX7G0Z2_9GAMM|nr:MULTISPECIES: DUF4339 domain-containing protein [Shewanella]MCL2918912.1 DUF4339 domain-containing protein [Shewanella litorisediminis]QRH00984.1 DUF4339 domain-containing protein [Shewanella litorisediminis]QYJ74490.1 DUF4339 domain-containing protein [Shewanella sp. FJAT-52076]QYK04362.1 DUF4339 domain-containing protein [Shewanella zhangzhouensis]